MYYQFKEMPGHSRIWIYQADRQLDDEESKQLISAVTSFLQQWQAHGKDLKSSVMLRHNRLLIIAVDEAFNQASGCSIDAKVHFLQDLQQKMHLNLFDRDHLLMWQDKTIQCIRIPALKNAVQTGQLSADTLVFNNMIKGKNELENNWLVPAKQTWLKRFFNREKLYNA